MANAMDSRLVVSGKGKKYLYLNPLCMWIICGICDDEDDGNDGRQKRLPQCPHNKRGVVRELTSSAARNALPLSCLNDEGTRATNDWTTTRHDWCKTDPLTASTLCPLTERDLKPERSDHCKTRLITNWGLEHKISVTQWWRTGNTNITPV